MDNTLDYAPLMTDQMKAVLHKQKELARDPFATDVSLQTMRENYIAERRFWNEGGPAMYAVENVDFHGEMGAYNVRIYRPRQGTHPLIVYIHGGGFVVGNCDTHDRICRLIAQKTGAVVASIDYHLSPESKFPTNIQECARVIQEMHAYAQTYGIFADDISIAGDSGGAVLAMATNLWLRDHEKDNGFITCLLLYYGYYGLTDSCSRRLFGNNIDGMRKQDLDYYNDAWLGTSDPERFSSPYFDMLSNDLATSMPHCFIASAGLDPLRDDSMCLHAILDSNHIPNIYKNYDGVVHGFLHYSRMLDQTNECIDASVAFWKNRNKRIS